MGGVTNIARYVAELGAHATDLPGCTTRPGSGSSAAVSSAAASRRLPAATGSPRSASTRCDRDLEEELIRALGVAGCSPSSRHKASSTRLRGLQQQPAQRERRPEDQLHRFFGSGRGGRSAMAGCWSRPSATTRFRCRSTAVLADALA